MEQDPWPAERTRRHESALSYYRNVFENEGIDERTWLERLATAEALNDLSAAFSLIHQRVAPLPKDRWLRHLGSRIFPTARRITGAKCQSMRVWGYTCPVGASPSELELDHSWPYGLGGRSEPSNGVWLCTVHNRVKSSDVHNYEWPLEEWPSWLLQMLTLIRRDCEQVLRSSVR